MRRRVLVCATLLGACGRLGFGDDEAAHNVVFITSDVHLPAPFDLATADAICADHAREASLPGTFVAFLSSGTSTTARSRLGNARGWVRTDGEPVADRIEDLTANVILHPIMLDENGENVGGADAPFTGTLSDGRVGTNCSDYTDPNGQITVGSTTAVQNRWVAANTFSCATPGRFYCFATDLDRPLDLPAPSARKAFVTTAPFIPDGTGIASADAHCSSEASLAGVSGQFKALLSTTTASAASRFDLRRPNWERLDGVALGPSPFAWMAGQRTATLNVDVLGDYTGGFVATGLDFANPNITSLLSSNCDDWTNPAGTAVRGESSFIDGSQFSQSTGGPCNAYPIYCLEE